MSQHWYQTTTIGSKSYICGHCGNPLASNIGYHGSGQSDGGGRADRFIYICHHCSKPTYFSESDEQSPGSRPGEDVSGIDDTGVETLYKEARDAYSKNAYTATVLCCRKLLMHIAVSKGAKKNEPFIAYVEYLAKKNYVPPDAKDWVDHIRNKGNEANHEIIIISKEEADDLISFVGMLMKLVYEFPSKMKKKL